MLTPDECGICLPVEYVVIYNINEILFKAEIFYPDMLGTVDSSFRASLSSLVD